MLDWVSERVPESATRRLRADRSRQTRDTPENATLAPPEATPPALSAAAGLGPQQLPVMLGI